MKNFIENWKSEKNILLTTILIGLLTHGYMLTNKLPNNDDYISIFHYGQGYASGRWFLSLMGNFLFRIDGTYSLPYFNGCLFVLSLSLSIVIFLKPLALKNNWVKIILASIFVAFPTATATLGYMFTTPFYGLAILFMAVAYYLLIEYKYGFLVSTILICLSLGTYQAYWGLIASFLLLYLIRQCLSKTTENKTIIKLSLKSLFSLLSGIIAYLLMNKIMLHIQGIHLDNYQGFSQMNSFNIASLPSSILKAYEFFFKFLTEDYLHITWYPIVRIIIALGYLISVALLIILLIRNKDNFKRFALLIFLIVFPLAVNSIYILTGSNSSIHTLMCYSVVCVFILPFIFIDSAHEEFENANPIKVTNYVYLAALSIVAVLYIRFANIYYLNLELAYTEAYSFMETLSTRIQDAEDYSSDKQIIFLGQYTKPHNTSIWELRMVNTMIGSIDVPNIINSYMIRQNFSRVYLGSTFNETADTSIIEKHSAYIADMPTYPDDGSIEVLEDYVIIKFSN